MYVYFDLMLVYRGLVLNKFKDDPKFNLGTICLVTDDTNLITILLLLTLRA